METESNPPKVPKIPTGGSCGCRLGAVHACAEYERWKAYVDRKREQERQEQRE